MPRWLTATYEPVTLFSLRMTHATNKGGKTLLVPTPYAVKMALLDACFRRFAAEEAEAGARRIFQLIKDKAIRILPPEDCVVQNTFLKILDHNRDGDSPFRQTIAYREFAYFSGTLTLALSIDGLKDDELLQITDLFAHINTFGKRGSFWQFRQAAIVEGHLAFEYTTPREEASLEQIFSHGITQALDDFGAALVKAKDGFDRVSTYGKGRITLGEHRVLTLTALPYRRRSAGKSFTWYRRSAP